MRSTNRSGSPSNSSLKTFRRLYRLAISPPFILKIGIAFGVRAGLALENDRAPVREDQPVPHEQHATLAEADIVVVLADDPRALRDKENVPGRAVIDVLRHLRRDRQPGKKTNLPEYEIICPGCFRPRTLLSHGRAQAVVITP